MERNPAFGTRKEIMDAVVVYRDGEVGGPRGVRVISSVPLLRTALPIDGGLYWQDYFSNYPEGMKVDELEVKLDPRLMRLTPS